MKEQKSLQDSELYESRYHFAERRSNGRFICGLLIVVWAIIIALNAWYSAFGGVQVDGDSMLNSFRSGEYLLVRYFEEGDELPYGSVIVVDVGHYPEVQAHNAAHPSQPPTKYLIKRLIAKEGDRVRCQNGVVQVWYAGTDGYQYLDEPYARYTNAYEYDFDEYVVGEGEIFFLGDNRNISLDSRYKENMSHIDGLYKETDIYGVVPEWAVKHKDVLAKIFFWRETLKR